MKLRFSEDVRPITDLKIKTTEVIDHARKTKRPVLITQRGRGAAILESLETFEEREQRYEAIEAVLEGLRQAREGTLHPHGEAVRILSAWGRAKKRA